MKNIKLSIITLISIGTFGFAGGDIQPVTIYETEDAGLAEEAVVEPVINEPVYIEPKKIETPKPKVVEKEINPSGFYAGLGITGAKYESDCKCKKGGAGTETNAALLARVGYDFNRYIGVEARGMKTVGDTDAVDITHVGVFLKPMIPVLSSTNLYALIGAAKTKTRGSLQHIDAEGISLGGGVEVDLSSDQAKDGKYSRPFDGEANQEKGVGLFIDYERLVVKSNAPDLDTISAGVTFDF